ncbi:WD40 repeat domain-containing protein [Methanosarcina sp. UBA5]|uniref:WD40 repeat domain-containing protein n=1 Tax=Methanosarcina sp. UBA5 TaxID=1915593 RepID=UPI0025EDC940|nr:WD40 repeat domain-containing protein [Methanosarcina sp. UBA5]
MGPEFQAYVGPRPFELEDKFIFFGRDREARDLLSLVIAHNLVLVYAQSGAGKTSLFNAGLIPLLKENQFEVLPVARVKGTPLNNIKTDEISNIYVFNTLTSWAEGECNIKCLARMKLVDFLNGQSRMQDEEGMPLPRVVIFDQFEEIFSLYQDRWKDRDGFFEQVSTVLEADPLLRVVFVMREDFIAQLDPYADLLPDRLRTRFHVESLRREAALLAIKGPLKYTGRSFEEGVAEKLVDELLTIRVETMPGKTAEVKGEFIEAVQLQVVCQNLWRELPPDVRQITFQHLKTYGNVEQELYRFYEEAIRAAAEKAHIDEEGLRRLCGEVMITTMGTRGMVYRAHDFTGGIPNAAIDVLESMHLIRAEWRAGARWYELTHDRFIKPILFSNKVFNDELAEKKRAKEEQAEKELSRSRNKKMGAAFFIILIIAGFATYHWYLAETEMREAHVSDELNLKSSLLQGDPRNLDKSVLLAIESFRISRTLDADQLMLGADRLIRQGLLLIPHSVVVLNHGDGVNNVMFSPDGKYVATASNGKAARLWNASTGKQIFVLNHEGSVNNVAFSPDGKYIATASNDNTACLWNASTGKEISVLNHEGPVNNVAFSPDGKYIATASSDSTSQVWNVATGKQIFVLNHGDVVNNVVFSPDGEYVATASNDSTSRLWDASTEYDILNHDNKVFKIVFSPDGKYVATASNDSTSRLWDASTGEQILAPLKHNGLVSNVVFSPDGKYMATASWDNTSRVWNASTGHVWNVSTGKEIFVLNHEGPVNNVVFSPDGKYIATVSSDKTARLWNASTGEQILVLNHNGSVNDVVFSPDGKYIATASSDKTARLWNAFTGEQILVPFKHYDRVVKVVFSPDGKYIATASRDKTARLWNVSTGEQITVLRHYDRVVKVVFSPDGKFIATASWDNTASLWNVSTGEKYFVLNHDGPVYSVVFSPDGKYVATASNDSTSHVWDTSKGKQITVLNHNGPVNDVVFSPDGKYMATASADYKARLWIFNIDNLINEASSRLTRNLTPEEWKKYMGDEPYHRTFPNLP